MLADTILPYLNDSVDSPIVSQCPSTSARRPGGTGDVDISDLLDDVSLCNIIIVRMGLLYYRQAIMRFLCSKCMY